MEYTGLLFEFMFLIMGIYLYFFSIGKVQSNDPEKQKKADDFRAQNAGWLKIVSLALVAIMVVNIYLHLQEILSN
ncbi:MAG: hypothetical protein NXI23_06855 [Bacteroidetes bacterium]|nr:hypothetical protein [Bacteroidota bacterium]MDF1864616.1 hypothetical protein [Saprospiraceae bacterium]